MIVVVVVMVVVVMAVVVVMVVVLMVVDEQILYICIHETVNLIISGQFILIKLGR
jgi:hypothetical protein